MRSRRTRLVLLLAALAVALAASAGTASARTVWLCKPGQTPDNHGRGFVLLAHSQGSLVLEQLIAKDIDTTPAVRQRLVSAVLLGGNVLVPGPAHPAHPKSVAGSFKHVPACRSVAQLGCVIAFSTFDQPPPANSIFGRTTVPR